MTTKKSSALYFMFNALLTIAVSAVFFVFFIQMPADVPLLFNHANGVTVVSDYASKFAFLPIGIIALAIGWLTSSFSMYQSGKKEYGKAKALNVASLVLNAILMFALIAAWGMISVAL